MAKPKKNYGWLPDHGDQRDYIFTPKKKRGIVDKLLNATQISTKKVDLRPSMPPIYDQGQVGSCTGNATGGAFEFELKRQNLPDFTPSRLEIYYNGRVYEKTTRHDSGAMIRDVVKGVANYGVCPETVWPYIESKVTRKPSTTCYKDAKTHLALQYQRIISTNDMKSCLDQGMPFIFGISVYDSFESDAVAKTGVVPMPKSNEQLLGGHALLAVGYDDSKQVFIFRNSWGTGWGMSGYGTIPYQYLSNSNLADDFWTISKVN
jgi:C1A family cysteine protease